MALQQIPLDTAPNQTWAVTVNINGGSQSFFCELNYNELSQYWTMNISAVNQNFSLSGIPLVTGLNILAQFAYLGIGSIYVINSSGVASPNFPNDSDLGSDFILLWGDNISTAEQIA
jgi:hypothetical protein